MGDRADGMDDHKSGGKVKRADPEGGTRKGLIPRGSGGLRSLNGFPRNLSATGSIWRSRVAWSRRAGGEEWDGPGRQRAEIGWASQSRSVEPAWEHRWRSFRRGGAKGRLQVLAREFV